jgi:hypothetical protein
MHIARACFLLTVLSVVTNVGTVGGQSQSVPTDRLRSGSAAVRRDAFYAMVNAAAVPMPTGSSAQPPTHGLVTLPKGSDGEGCLGSA